MRRSRLERIGSSLLGSCAAYQVLMGAYFVAVRPPLLPEDERAIGMTLVEAERNVPGLALWLDRVFAVLGVDEDEPSRFDPTLTGLPARPLAGDVRPRLLSRPYGFF